MPPRAITDSEIENCFSVMSELQPHLERRDFVATIRAMEESFRLVYIELDGSMAAGYHFTEATAQ
tara:strand:- start:459 stop:653 length:195 start_codon:yes stop_codon:yes gene_type:complete